MTSTERSEPRWAPPTSSARVEAESSRDSTARNARPTSGGSPSIVLPFDSLRSAVDWWFRPLGDPSTWLALGYLFVGAMLGPLLFAATLVMLVTVGALSLVAIGLALVVPAFGAVNAMATLERRRAGWVGDPIAPRRLQRATSRRAAISTRINDAARWRQVAYLLLMLVAGPVFFAVGSTLWVVVLQLVVAPAFDGISLTGTIFGIIVAGGAARLGVFVADIARSFTAWFLGPDPSEALEERVVELASQREQILDAVAGERRRIERNLHDGVQQQLVALGIDIGRASARLDDDPEGARELLGEAREKVRGSIGELRMIGRGLHPAVLSDRGLDAALSAVVANAPIPISVEVTTGHDLPTDVAETAYYVVNEAVANVLKHARARTASVRVADEPGVLPAIRITVHDDGRGGASTSGGSGSGLAGITARVEGADGVVDLESPTGGPTLLTVVLPVRSERVRTAGADGAPEVGS